MPLTTKVELYAAIRRTTGQGGPARESLMRGDVLTIGGLLNDPAHDDLRGIHDARKRWDAARRVRHGIHP